jgi:hypothetical protein
VTSDGVFLDGCNRIQVGCVLELDAVIEKIDPLYPAAYIISKNIIRRHLSTGQRAMIAEKIANLPHGVRVDQALRNLGAAQVTQAQAAQQLGTTPRAITQALKSVCGSGF